MHPANDPPPPRSAPETWLRAVLTLADGRALELTLPGAVAGSVSACDAPPDGIPSLTLIEPGRRRRGSLAGLFGQPAPREDP